MTRVTAGVRIQSAWYRQCCAAAQSRAVTGHATILWPAIAGQVLSVIEADIETLFKAIGKTFARRIAAVHRLMADRAHGNIRGGELRQMTTRAIFVAGKIRPHRVV